MSYKSITDPIQQKREEERKWRQQQNQQKELEMSHDNNVDHKINSYVSQQQQYSHPYQYSYQQQGQSQPQQNDNTNRSSADDLSAAISSVAPVFHHHHDAVKFEAQEILAALLTHSSENNRNREVEPEWAWHVQRGLRDVLGSRLGREQREGALWLLDAMLRNEGGGWTLQDREGNIREDNEECCQFVEMIVRVVNVEVRVALEEVLKNPKASSSLSSSSPSSTTPSSSSTSSLPLGGKLALRCMVDMLLLLSPEHEETSAWAQLPTDTLIAVQRTLLDTIRTVMEFLEGVADLYEEGTVADDDEGMRDAGHTCVRALGTWASRLRVPHLRAMTLTEGEGEEGSGLYQMDTRMTAILPFLATWFPLNSLGQGDAMDDHPLVWMAPYLAFLTAQYLDAPPVRSLFSIHRIHENIAHLLRHDRLLEPDLPSIAAPLLDILVNLTSPTAVASDNDQQGYALPFLPLLDTLADILSEMRIRFQNDAKQSYPSHHSILLSCGYLTTATACLLLYDEQRHLSVWPSIVDGFLYHGGRYIEHDDDLDDSLLEMWELTARCFAISIANHPSTEFSWIKSRRNVQGLIQRLAKNSYHQIAVICKELEDQILSV